MKLPLENWEKFYDVPLFSQSWDLDKWKGLGFKSHSDAEYWEKSCCGILCVKEIATYLTDKEYSTWGLIKKGLSLSGYTHKNGWSHEGLILLARELGLNAEKTNCEVGNLQKALDEKKLPIVSIKWAFIPKKYFKEKLFFWKKYGGHLAVVVGYDNKGFFVNHTSIVPEKNWKAKHIPFEQFRASYTGRSILVWK